MNQPQQLVLILLIVFILVGVFTRKLSADPAQPSELPYSYTFSTASNYSTACAQSGSAITVYGNSIVIEIGVALFSDPFGQTPLADGWYGFGGIAVNVVDGLANLIFNCI